MSSNEQAIVYSEVYSILNMLGDNYINLLPDKLYNFIKENKNANYSPIYDINIPLSKQNIKKRTASFLCMLHYKYWCKTDAEKTKVIEILDDNEEKIKEKYNYDNIFINNRKSENIKSESAVTSENNKIEENNSIQESTSLKEIKENIFKKLINFIKKFFRINK